MKKRFRIEMMEDLDQNKVEGTAYDGDEVIGVSLGDYGSTHEVKRDLIQDIKDLVADKITGRQGDCIALITVRRNDRWLGDTILCSCGGEAETYPNYRGTVTENPCDGCKCLYNSSGQRITKTFDECDDMDEYYTRCGAEDGE